MIIEIKFALYACFFISNEVAKGLTLKTLSNLISNLQR